MAKTLNGGALIPYGPTLPITTTAADGTLFYKTNSVGKPAGLYVYGFISDVNTAAFGAQVSQQWFAASATLDINVLSGVLSVPKGGTGTISAVQGGLAFGATSTTVGYTAAGIVGQVLTSNGAGTPLWVNQGTLNVNSAQTAGSAGTLTTPRTIALSGGAVGTATSFNGSASITIPVTSLLATSLSGTIPSGNLSGSYNISITGSAASATTAVTANSATTAGTATTLTVARNITLSGGASGSAPFNGSADAAITVTVNNVQGYAPNTAATVNTLALRDNSGYLYASYFNSSAPNSEAGTISQIMYTNGTDNFLRKTSLATLTAAIGGGYVLKAGDVMTGSLATTAMAIGAVSMPGSGSINLAANLTAFGYVVATGNISSNGGNITASTGQIIATNGAVRAGAAGSTGYVALQSPGSANSGYAEFYGSSQIRAGYIGNTASVSGTDTGVINYVASAHAFSGNITATGNVTAYSSDGRLKKNITPIENAVQKVIRLGGYQYDWDMVKCNEVGFKPEREHEHGLIAQDVEMVLPDAVAPAPFNDKYLTVRYDRIVALLTAAIGEQQKQIDALLAKVTALEDK